MGILDDQVRKKVIHVLKQVVQARLGPDHFGGHLHAATSVKSRLLLQPMTVHLQITFSGLGHRIVVQQTGYCQNLNIIERDNVQ
ncbi:hypothetical protein D3C87_1928320 [compost metagenome]